MPEYNSQEIADIVRNYYKNKNSGSGSFAVPKTPEQQLNSMPNANKLTKFERGVYGALPGVTKWMENKRIMGGTISEQLDKFNNSWLGKGLNMMDVFAEGFERAVGTGEQILHEGVWDFDYSQKNLKAAWYGSSLYWDTANLPQWKRDNQGQIVGMRMPTDLPGVPGLIDQRADIKHYMELGLAPDEALARVRDDYYGGLGALALRAQMNDLYGHVLGDPLNLLTAYIKPLEALKVRRLSAMTGKIAGGADELVASADNAFKLLKSAGNADDALSLGDEAYQLASMAGDTKRAAQYAAEAATVARKAGKVDEAARLEQEAIRLTTMSSKAAARFSDDALKALGKKQVTTADKFFIALSGGDPLRPASMPNWIEKVPGVGKVAKAFALTPESKAKEMIILVGDNIGTQVIGRMMNMPNAEAEFASYIRRVAKGATGIEYGHAMLTLEGRTVQAFTKGAEAAVEHLFSTYQKVGKERAVLTTLSDLLGEAPSKLLRLMDEEPEVLMDLLVKKQGMNPAIDLMVQSGELTPDGLRALSKTIGDMPYNKEMFFAKALDAIETQAMRQSVVQFGVQSKGLLTRWSDAMKAAESLAFLRLSPSYPIRNIINNEFTMLGRGVFGVINDGAITKFWDDFGAVPKRLSDDITPAQIEKVTSEADKILEDALRGGYYGTPDKAKEFFQKISLGKLDMAKAGQGAERWASRRAFTLGTQQFLRKYFRPKSIREYVRPQILDAIEDINPEFAQHFDNAIRASGAVEKKFDDLLGNSLHLNVDSIMDEVSQQLGMEVRDVLGDELLEHIHQNLPDALANGTLDSFKVQTRQMVNDHIEDLFNKQIENVVEHVKSQIVAGGDTLLAKKLGEAQDIFWGAHIEHSIRMPEATRLAREASVTGDFRTARALWRQEQQDAQQFYSRAFKRVDAYIQGLEEATAELGKRGAQMPWGDVRRAFAEWREGWAQFFAEKNRILDEFWTTFDATPKGQRPPQSIDDVQSQIQSMYNAMTEQEDALTQRIDDLVANTIPDPTARKAYMNARDTLADMRKADKKAINKMYRDTANMEAGERQKAWNDFWKKRTEAYQQMRSVEAASIAIQQGDPAATQKFTEARKATEKAAGESGEFDVYKMAEQYGIETTTKKGTRNDRRILNTINKYLGQKEDLLKGADEAPAVKLPRHELPPAVNEKMELYARQLLDELRAGQAGKRMSREVMEGGAVKTEWFGVSSTNADWYRELYQRGISKKAVDKALEKIIQDNGADKGVNVERLKQVILDRIRYGDPKKGNPPDLYALQELGASDKVLKEALVEYNDITRQETKLEDAIAQASPSDLHDPTQPYYDDAGNLVLPSRYGNLKDVPEEAAKKAFDARAKAKGVELPAEEPEVTPEFIADVEKVIPNPVPFDLGLDMMTYGRSYGALDAVIDGAKAAAQKTPTKLADLPEELQREVRKAIRLAKNDMASTRYQAMKFGEWRRDSALLNYNRRTNFDNWLGHVAPFVFWSTHSMWNWAIESIDRPAMLTNYMRYREFWATAGLQNDGMATRAKGKIRVELPFAPDWMGEQFIDPLRTMLPFDNWLTPFDQLKANAESLDGRTERFLEQQLAEGSISQEDYKNALETRSGGLWDFARTKTAGNDADGNYDAWDFATSLAAPHAPLMWAYNAAFGNKENIGSFTPMSRITRNAATLLGVEDWNNSKWNLEAKVRRQMGLPAFDKWDDYRIDRSLANLTGDGSFTIDEVKEAMAISALVQQGKLDPEEAKEMSEAYREGVKRSNQEYTGGAAAFGLQLLGFSITSIPKGEVELRKLGDDFGRAYESYRRANDSLEAYIADHPEMEDEAASEAWAKENPRLANSVDDLKEFFDEHPEYEARLGIFDEPEERLHKFMIDSVWQRFNELPKVNQNELRDQLGSEFSDAFLNKDTRSYDDIPTELMGVWLKLMGTDPLGGLTADQRVLKALYGKIELTDPETAWRVQVFYDQRDQNFDGWRDAQNGYYELPKGSQRKAYLSSHPELKQYWDFRTSFMRNNPDLVPYLTDNEKAIEEARNAARTEAAVPTAQELAQVAGKLPPYVRDLVFDYAQTGEALPPVVIEELQFIASQQGLEPQQMVNILGAR